MRNKSPLQIFNSSVLQWFFLQVHAMAKATLIFFILIFVLAEAQKPGFCPRPEGLGICAFTCSSDSECRDNLKCCQTACGGTSCTQPTLPKPPGPGTCEIDKSNKNFHWLIKHHVVSKNLIRVKFLNHYVKKCFIYINRKTRILPSKTFRPLDMQ